MTERRSGITKVQGMDDVTEIYGLCQYEGHSYATTDKGIYRVKDGTASLVVPQSNVPTTLASRDTKWYVKTTLNYGEGIW